MAQVAPTPSTPLGPVPTTADPANFDSRADNFLGALPTYQTELDGIAENVFDNAVDAYNNASAASSSAAAAALASGAPIWVAGSYVTGAPTYSPINGMVYRRLAPGGATTLDPSADPAKWFPIAGGDVTQAGVQTLANKTLANITETVYAPAAGSAFTINWANGPIQRLTINANAIITLPAAATGNGGLLVIVYTGAYTVTFTGGTLIKYQSGTPPVPTSANGKKDYYAVVCDDATATSVQDGGRGF